MRSRYLAVALFVFGCSPAEPKEEESQSVVLSSPAHQVLPPVATPVVRPEAPAIVVTPPQIMPVKPTPAVKITTPAPKVAAKADPPKPQSPPPTAPVAKVDPPKTQVAKAAPKIPPVVRKPKKLIYEPLLVSKSTHDHYMTFWPDTDSKLNKELKEQKEIIFYDDAVMPSVYQVYDRGINGSGLFQTFGGQLTANREFPWTSPAGVTDSSKVRRISFCHLPAPIEWFSKERRDGFFAKYDWEYPEGTIFGEILTIQDPNGFDHTWKFRVRTKRSDGLWTPASYAPFPSADKLHAELLKRGIDWTPEEIVPAMIDTRLAPFNHVNNAFIDRAFMSGTPSLPASLISELLDTTTFESEGGKTWIEEEGVSVVSPTTDQDFDIVPKGYQGAFIPVEIDSCMRCHKDAGKIVNLQDQQRWRLRGNDGIFSFHIFDPDSVRTMPLRLNKKLVDAGLLVHKAGMP